MRIAGYIEHPQLKITVFELENKFMVKLESGLFEQTYKFRKSMTIDSVDAIREVISEDFIEKVTQVFPQMYNIRQEALLKKLPKENKTEFEEII